MGVKDSNYQTVYYGEALGRFIPGGMVFFQRDPALGGYWLGYTHEDGFEFIFNRPVGYWWALTWLANMNSVPQPSPDDFQLE